MIEEQVTELVQNTVLESTGQSLTIKPEEELLRSGILDSLTLLQVFTEIQSAFGVELEPDIITEENFGSISAIAATVRDFLN